MQTPLKILTIIFVILALVFMAASINDYFSVESNFSEYQWVYRIGEAKNSGEWQYRSKENFKTWHVMKASAAAIYILLGILYLSIKTRVLRNVVLIVDCALIFWILSSLF